MKKIVLIILLLLLANNSFASSTSPTKKIVLVNEVVVTASTSGKLVSLTDNGYVEIFAHDKIYISLSGVTPNISSRYLTAGSSLDTEVFYYVNNKIGFLADSGTSTINITTYKYSGE